MVKLQKLVDGDGFDGIPYAVEFSEFDQRDILERSPLFYNRL